MATSASRPHRLIRPLRSTASPSPSVRVAWCSPARDVSKVTVKVTDSLAARAAGTEATVNPAPDSAGVPRATVSVPVLVTTIVPVVAAAGRTVPKSTLEALSWTLAPLAATAAA